ncbi:transposase family protein [Streptomyces sp. NPDC006553]|uniref:transposase family protein n=1 Tax=Streptomyces sp. NPDC006553 TaxID=3157180 RepID=UPI0033B31A54
MKRWADKAYQGVTGPVPVPFRGRRRKRGKRRRNTTHAKIRCLAEWAMATLQGRRLLRNCRCSTNRITDVVKAVLVLHHASA